MPVICLKCGDLVELYKTRKSPLNEQLICKQCFEKENEVKELIEEAKDIHYDLENYAEYMKGDRNGWKNNLKQLKNKIKELGFDDFV